MTKLLGLSRDETTQAIRQGKVTICVVGLGFVGLPLAVLFASEGARVIGCVRTEKSAQKINRGETHITEHDVSSLLRQGASMLEASCPNCGVRLFSLKNETFCPCCGKLASVTEFGVHLQDNAAMAHRRIVETRQSLQDLLKDALKRDRFHATTETTKALQQSDVVLITVGTPIDEKKNPDYADLRKACLDVGRGLERDAIVAVKSTVSPGITENLVKPTLETESKMKAGVDFALSFMPETIKEGHALYEFRTLPRIVAGVTRRCADATANVFSVFPAPIYVFEKTAVVEAAKLFMNLYRDVNIALANEFALISEKLGLDVTQAINAANIDPKTHLLTPGLVGGYCLPKDTYHLVSPSNKAGYTPRLITLARQLNDAMPSHIFELINEVFNEMNKSMKGAKIAVLGLGFKANSGDMRNTQAEPIIRALLEQGAVVTGQDPFVQVDAVREIFPELTFSRKIEEAVKGASCTVITTEHLEYRGLTARYLKRLMSARSAIVDARHVIDPNGAKTAGVAFRGLGKPRI